jgi:hypothetical protein
MFYLVEIAIGKLFARMAALDAGTCDEDANLVAVGENLGRKRRDLLGVGHVGGVDPCFAAELFNGFFCFGAAGVALKLVSCLFNIG